jgi:hypothetical protein
MTSLFITTSNGQSWWLIEIVLKDSYAIESSTVVSSRTALPAEYRD